MKKYLIFLFSAALLFAGCAKESFSVAEGEGVLTEVSLNAAIPSECSKAVADGDGAAASVNRCIMEIYYGDDLFTRMYAPVNNKLASFTLQLVSNRTYNVAFWADHVDYPTTEAGIATDKYYETNSADGLKAVALKGAYAGNLDERDAFALCKEFTIAQTGSTFNAVLRRPFAQINVITTDVATVKKVASLVPETVALTIKNAVSKYNVIDSTAVAGQLANLTYEASLYNWDESKAECTLSMDYIFAEKEKNVIDIDWQAKKAGNTPVAHSFTAIPYQRNYRTNIKGALLTTIGKWNVTIEPTWSGVEDYPYYNATVDNIEALNEALASGQAGAAKNIDATVTMPTDSDTQTVDFTDNNNGQNINIKITGELGTGKTVNFGTSGTEGPANLDISAPSGTSMTFDTEFSHVTINGTEYNNISGTFSANSLVIPAGVTVKSLNIVAGGLNIHGTLEAVTVDSNHGEIFLRESEGLNSNVYTALKDYIDRPAYTEKKVGDKYDIVKSAFTVIRNTEIVGGYSTIDDAIKSAQAGDIVSIWVDNVVIPAFDKSGITICGNGTAQVTEISNFSAANVTLDGLHFNCQLGLSAPGFSVKNSMFTGYNAFRWSYCNGEQVLIENCVFNTERFAIHFDEGSAPLIVRNCQMRGFCTFGSSLASVTFENCDFVDSSINEIYAAQTWGQHMYFNNCSFSENWCTINDNQTIGLVQANGVAEFSNCTVAKGTLAQACANSNPEALCAIDAQKDQNGKYTKGTFFGNKEKIVIPDGYLVTTLGTNIYDVTKVDGVAKVGDTYYKTLTEALAAVTPATPLLWVDSSVWADNNSSYYNKKFYTTLREAINAADAVNSSEPALIYIRPNFSFTEVPNHDYITTSITIFGNNASLNATWEPTVEYNDISVDNCGHTLTKNISFSLYNLNDGAGIWGKRTSAYTVDARMENCQNVHEFMINDDKGSENSITNCTIINCTFQQGNGMKGADCPVTTTNPGTVTVKNCTFKDFSNNYVFNINNKNGGNLTVVAENLTFDNCGSSSKQAFRLMGEAVGSTLDATLKNISFSNNAGKIGDIIVGKADADDNQAEVTYHISETAGKMNVYTVKSAELKAEINLNASESYSGDNK